MKSAFSKFVLVLAGIILGSSILYAQDKKQLNSAAFEKLRSLIGKQDASGMYALTNEEFKKNINWVNFENFARYGIFAQGAIVADTLTDYRDPVSNYKMTFPSGDFNLKLSVDSVGKINFLLFKKVYVPDATTKKAKTHTPDPQAVGIDRTIEEIASEYINRDNTVGLSVGFLQKGIMRGYNYGEAEKGSGVSPNGHSAYEIGSITKTFTATLLAWYVNAGKVSLSDPITKYLPDSVKLNKNLKGITLQMLSNHTSGLSRIPDNLGGGNSDPLNPYKNYDRKKLYSYLKHCKPEALPGKVFSYSNTGAGLLGTILEKVSGKTYTQMVTEIIATPLKLESIGTKFTGDHAPHILPVYNDKGKATPVWDFDALKGAGALRSTCSDLLRYAEANIDLNSSPLGKALALTHQITYDKETTVGLGWFKKKIGHNEVYWHNGGTYGSSSFVAFVPGKGIALVVLSNSAESVDEIAGKILAAVED